MTRHRNLLDRKWEFEAATSYYGDRFLRILTVFRINPEDIYISPDFFDVTQIEFRTTKKKKMQIECVFRRLIELEGHLNGDAIYQIY